MFMCFKIVLGPYKDDFLQFLHARHFIACFLRGSFKLVRPLIGYSHPFEAVVTPAVQLTILSRPAIVV